MSGPEMGGPGGITWVPPKTCSTCRYSFNGAELHGDARLQCHRRAPIMPRSPDDKTYRLSGHETAFRGWPIVFADDWCGEFESKEGLRF
jgi:hypothetical protein